MKELTDDKNNDLFQKISSLEDEIHSNRLTKFPENRYKSLLKITDNYEHVRRSLNFDNLDNVNFNENPAKLKDGENKELDQSPFFGEERKDDLIGDKNNQKNEPQMNDKSQTGEMEKTNEKLETKKTLLNFQKEFINMLTKYDFFETKNNKEISELKLSITKYLQSTFGSIKPLKDILTEPKTQEEKVKPN